MDSMDLYNVVASSDADLASVGWWNIDLEKNKGKKECEVIVENNFNKYRGLVWYQKINTLKPTYEETIKRIRDKSKEI